MPVADLSHNKICNLEDFTHPGLYPVLRDIFAHEIVRFGDGFPVGRENRKDWEAAMAVRAFAEGGLLDGEREFLGVAAGNEPLAFYLTRFARRVFATDLYLHGGEWEVFGHASMLDDPHRHWPFPWNPRRLVVQHMNALDLQYEDESFDGVFSSSSIEHFGGHGEAERSMDEMCRVLRPGGVCAVSTEFRLSGQSPGLPGCLLFDEDELHAHLVGDRPWHLLSPLDLSVSNATLASRTEVRRVVAEQLEQCDRDGGWFTHKLDYSHFPHIVMTLGDFTFTSVQVALQKDEEGASQTVRPRREPEVAHRAPALAGSHSVSLGQTPLTGTGWHEPHDSPWGHARWTGPGRDAALDIPLVVQPGATVEMLVVDAAAPHVLEGLRVEVNGLPLELEREPHDGATLIRGVVPPSYGSLRAGTRLSLRTPKIPEGRDDGLEGVAVLWVRFTSAP